MTRALRALVFIGAFQMLFQGLDYLLNFGQDPRPVEFSHATPHIWGAACLITAALLSWSIFYRNPKGLVFASAVAFSVNFMLGMSATSIIYIGGAFDDWRVMTEFWGEAAKWAVISLAVSFRHGVNLILQRRSEGDN